jgi:hypothetical protein
MGAAGALISSSAVSQALPGVLLPQAPAAATPNPWAPATQSVIPTAPGGIDPQLFAKAKAALDVHRIGPRDTIGIVDFSKPSSEERFYLVDLMSGNVDAYRVAHGRGSDPDHSGFLERFSNDFGSHASSNGTYTTDD